MCKRGTSFTQHSFTRMGNLVKIGENRGGSQLPFLKVLVLKVLTCPKPVGATVRIDIIRS